MFTVNEKKKIEPIINYNRVKIKQIEGSALKWHNISKNIKMKRKI